MKFIVDAQLPPALAGWLRDVGHEALPVREIGLRDAEDEVIWEYARKAGAVIVTKDEDFAILAKGSGAAPVIVWLRIGNCSNEDLRVWLEPRLPGIVELIEQGGRIVEVV